MNILFFFGLILIITGLCLIFFVIFSAFKIRNQKHELPEKKNRKFSKTSTNQSRWSIYIFFRNITFIFSIFSIIILLNFLANY